MTPRRAISPRPWISIIVSRLVFPRVVETWIVINLDFFRINVELFWTKHYVDQTVEKKKLPCPRLWGGT